jgi:replicative DNA helicase
MLSCLAHGNDKVQQDMMERLREDHFYSHETRLMFQAALRIHAKRIHINWVNIEDELRATGHFDVIGGSGKLTEVSAFCPNSKDWQRYFPKLEEARYRRSLETLANDIVVKARDRELPLQDLKQWSEASVMKADFVIDEDDRLSTAKSIEGAIDNIEALSRGEMRRGIPTGLSALDEYLTLGLRGGDMVVLAARPAMGKSSAAMQIAEYVAVDLRKRVLIFSLEMTSTSLMERMIKSRSKISLQTLVSGKMNQFQLDAIRTATNQISSAPILCDDGAGKSIGYIKSVSRRAHQREPIDLIVIDYLQLVRGDSRRSRDNRTCEVEEVSNGIKELAKDLNVPVLALAQLNRDPEKRNGRPSMSDLKGSGSLEQDADICILMNFSEEELDTFSQTPKMEFIVAKQREGPTGTGTMVFNKAITRFVSE